MAGSVDERIHAICVRARAAARALVPRPRADKDAALRAVARELRARKAAILAANAADMAAARERGTSGAMLDRLMLDEARVEAMARGAEEIAELPDPVGETISETVRPNGLRVARVRVPLGVIAIVYEARPNVTVDAGALALKAGNAVVLRGGSEALRSNQALVEALAVSLEASALPRDAVQLVPFTEREGIRALVQQTELVDLAIPRGGEALIRFVTEHARVPVVQHYKGVCHVYLDEGADLETSKRIVSNAKLQRPGVCNAAECLLVARADAKRLLPPIADVLVTGGCELRGTPDVCTLVPAAKPAQDDDWGREYLDKILAVKIVGGLDEALEHVARYGSQHTEAIVTPNAEHAARWLREVDAACVVVNASTRFHDGGELGLGAEMGIATSRLHWRGPMGLESLTTMKWVVVGEGQTRG
jgi:glutamate-5-semialdehyde dehydrogenase